MNQQFFGQMLNDKTCFSYLSLLLVRPGPEPRTNFIADTETQIIVWLKLILACHWCFLVNFLRTLF